MSTHRDRDDEGRARNARPRDGLGRPLPYGAEGVERQPEGIERTPQETVREAQRLLEAGMPFHAHEVFEDAWKTGPPEEEGLWRGMAQLAVGVTHAARGNLPGAASLLRRGADNIAPFRGVAHELDIDGIRRWAEDLAADLEARPEVREAASLAPRLRAERDSAS
ncbi:hypothetical protein SAMN05216266_102301 [Amycolatopsis marina]|uniref:DUF309 domain-containing protein n=1 Tax=Amycolatopsis marina TaxID=490629 RepID=A0A1I0WXK5_9PSEU|nr:DUF309 domain-containing protein [Amycolatopsis marina]SFA93455.1 hypothetical protein SAMN05216266_102301 [Amycolatopsis marina]